MSLSSIYSPNNERIARAALDNMQACIADIDVMGLVHRSIHYTKRYWNALYAEMRYVFDGGISTAPTSWRSGIFWEELTEGQSRKGTSAATRWLYA